MVTMPVVTNADSTVTLRIVESKPTSLGMLFIVVLVSPEPASGNITVMSAVIEEALTLKETLSSLTPTCVATRVFMSFCAVLSKELTSPSKVTSIAMTLS